jgi:hypothetical protein
MPSPLNMCSCSALLFDKSNTQPWAKHTTLRSRTRTALSGLRDALHSVTCTNYVAVVCVEADLEAQTHIGISSTTKIFF